MGATQLLTPQTQAAPVPLKVEDNWAAGVSIKTPTRVVFVSEQDRLPVFMKIPGGRRRAGDATKLATALREGFEETGIKLKPHELRHLKSYDRHNHTYELFVAEIADERLAEAYDIAKNGEKVHILTYAEARAARGKILPVHLRMIDEHNLLVGRS